MYVCSFRIHERSFRVLVKEGMANRRSRPIRQRTRAGGCGVWLSWDINYIISDRAHEVCACVRDISSSVKNLESLEKAKNPA